MNIENNSILNIHLNPEGILRIVLNNPKSHNTLSEKMISSLQQSLNDAASDEKVRVVIIAAEGSTFSAGHDLKEMKAGRLDPDKGKSYFNKIDLISITFNQKHSNVKKQSVRFHTNQTTFVKIIRLHQN